ncbi:MAG: nucleotidyltransferase domain-containing protein [Limnochordaceae bacterium]|nr:nucleotidyltransferase domain-containing protein [Limnochordaceae bacterium]
MSEQPWRDRLERSLQKAVQQIASRYRPARIILFGSLARGDVHEDSDIDLLIIKQTDRPFLKRIDDVLAVLDTEVPVEPIVYTEHEFERLAREGRDFIDTILREGRVLYDCRHGSEPPRGRALAQHR